MRSCFTLSSLRAFLHNTRISVQLHNNNGDDDNDNKVIINIIIVVVVVVIITIIIIIMLLLNYTTIIIKNAEKINNVDFVFQDKSVGWTALGSL